MKKRLLPLAVFGAVFIGFGLLLEGLGRVAIYFIEKRAPTGIMAENILSHQEPVLGFGLKKNLKESMGHWTVETNALGFRSTEAISPQKEPNEIRLFVVGGSTVFGWGVEAKDSIPGYLQKLTDETLAKEFPGTHHRVRILNAGVPWYASWHETALVLFRLLPLSPDALVIVDGLNDTAASLAPDWSPIHLGFLDPPTRIAFEKKSTHGSGGLLSDVLQLSPSLRYLIARRHEKNQLVRGVYHPEVWPQYLRYAHALQTLAQSSGVSLFRYFQPVMPVDKEIQYLEKITNGTSMQSPEFAEVFRKTYLEGEEKLLAAKELGVVSLKSLFKTVTYPIYLDGLHYSDYGNRLIAERVFEDSVRPFIQQKLAPQKIASR